MHTAQNYHRLRKPSFYYPGNFETINYQRSCGSDADKIKLTKSGQIRRKMIKADTLCMGIENADLMPVMFKHGSHPCQPKRRHN
jgi:hypothetical protein